MAMTAPDLFEGFTIKQVRRYWDEDRDPCQNETTNRQQTLSK